MRQMNRQASLRMLRPIYEPLLTQLNLSAQQRAQFYDAMLAMDDPGGMLDKLPNDAETPEERAQIEGQIQQTHDSALAQIQQMFSSGEYQLYDSYRKTEGERMLVQQFRQQLDSSSIQMSDWQSASLRDLLIQARAEYPPVNEDMTASDEATLAQATQFLTPEQLTAFRDYLHNQEEMTREIRKLQTPGG